MLHLARRIREEGRHLLTAADFDRYDADNPEVWTLFERFALDAMRAGRAHFGAKSIFERIRWYTEVESSGDFKVNNNFASFYARKFMDLHPEAAGLFELRHSVADDFGSAQDDAQREMPVPVARQARRVVDDLFGNQGLSNG